MLYLIFYVKQVFGVHDARLGEAVVAAVIKRKGSELSEEEVKKYCEGKVLITY